MATPETDQFLARLEPLGELGQGPQGFNGLRPLRARVEKASGLPRGQPLPYVPLSRERPHDGERLTLRVFRLPASGESFAAIELATINCYLARRGAGPYAFSLLTDRWPQLPGGAHAGWFFLRLKNPLGEDIPHHLPGMPIPILGPPAQRVLLACSLEVAGGARGPLSATYPLSNMAHLVGSMLAEGGLTCVFHAVYSRTSPNKDNRDFPYRGRALAERFGSLSLDALDTSDGSGPKLQPHQRSGDLCLGSSGINESGQLLEILQLVRGQVLEQYVPIDFSGEPRAAPRLSGPPRIKRLAILCHGYHQGLYIGDFGPRLPGSHAPRLNNEHLPAFGAALKQEGTFAPKAVVTIFGCSAGMGPPPDVAFGELPAAGKKLGAGSFAEALRRELAGGTGGTPDLAVWAHTSDGDMTLNQELRFFLREQVVDALWLVYAEPPVASERTDRRMRWARFFTQATAPQVVAPRFPQVLALEKLAMTYPDPRPKIEGPPQ